MTAEQKMLFIANALRNMVGDMDKYMYDAPERYKRELLRHADDLSGVSETGDAGGHDILLGLATGETSVQEFNKATMKAK